MYCWCRVAGNVLHQTNCIHWNSKSSPALAEVVLVQHSTCLASWGRPLKKTSADLVRSGSALTILYSILSLQCRSVLCTVSKGICGKVNVLRMVRKTFRACQNYRDSFAQSFILDVQLLKYISEIKNLCRIQL